MNDESNIAVHVLTFGPLAETLGWKTQTTSITQPATVGKLIQQLNLVNWQEEQLVFAVNGVQCTTRTALKNGDEVALLPPVSGG
ncbi:MAG: MoaD/ThiS family protein [Candidatus Poseidoniaceae archaeon]|jgi:molybdopterin converting factor small subunit|nr:MoaD/ThiS family protein [Candidatus Poseidoniaceae archaeon]